MTISKKECFDWDLNILNSQNMHSISIKESQRTSMLHSKMFKSEVFAPNHPNILNVFDPKLVIINFLLKDCRNRSCKRSSCR
jgi:hypothetical protein